MIIWSVEGLRGSSGRRLSSRVMKTISNRAEFEFPILVMLVPSLVGCAASGDWTKVQFPPMPAYGTMRKEISLHR